MQQAPPQPRPKVKLILNLILLAAIAGGLEWAFFQPAVSWNAGDCIGRSDRGGVGRMDCSDPAVTYQLVRGGTSCEAPEESIKVTRRGEDFYPSPDHRSRPRLCTHSVPPK